MFGTLGADFSSEDRPLQRADVALHCGDLTASSRRPDFRTSLEMLKSREAPLKLIIAGNHDFTMDHAVERRVAEAVPHLGPKLLARDYGTLREARKLFADAKDAGIVFLDEGTHRFKLENAAMLIIYASPYTPSLRAWDFQYDPKEGYPFNVQEGIDIVMTYGPPKGIMD